ncbi:MAG: MFS transporter [Chloroflexi bacterium]|nr:MAG: MFS transporter [Chloroflexota bacterium]
MMDRERAAHVAWTPAVVRLMAGLMLSMFVAAMDSTVVGTALPTIAKELGQFSLYPWVFSGYLITATTSVPLWGRLADSKGRKSVLLAGMAIFVIASVLCAASPGMGWLIAFRTAQGIGAGCVQPLVFTILSDVFPLAQRARLTGFFSAMWAIAAIIGPALGALFVSTVGWRWIFLINLPAGVISTALVLGYRERRPATAAGGIDLRSGLLLTAGIALLLWGLGSGSASATPNWPIVGLALLILAAFGLVEARSRHPILPLDLLRHPVIGPAVLMATIGGILMFGVTAYLPLHVQRVYGGSVFAAGVAVGVMSLGWPVASASAGWVMVRVGYQRLVMGGAAVLVLATAMLAIGPPAGASGTLWDGAASLVMGAGMGLISAPLLIVIQNSVPWERRGAATAMNQFARTIGGAIGISLMGVLVQVYVRDAADPLTARAQLAAGLHALFVSLLVLAAVGFVNGLAILVSGYASKRDVVVLSTQDRDADTRAGAAGS